MRVTVQASCESRAEPYPPILVRLIEFTLETSHADHPKLVSRPSCPDLGQGLHPWHGWRVAPAGDRRDGAAGRGDPHRAGRDRDDDAQRNTAAENRREPGRARDRRGREQRSPSGRRFARWRQRRSAAGPARRSHRGIGHAGNHRHGARPDAGRVRPRHAKRPGRVGDRCATPDRRVVEHHLGRSRRLGQSRPGTPERPRHADDHRHHLADDRRGLHRRRRARRGRHRAHGR